MKRSRSVAVLRSSLGAYVIILAISDLRSRHLQKLLASRHVAIVAPNHSLLQMCVQNVLFTGESEDFAVFWPNLGPFVYSVGIFSTSARRNTFSSFAGLAARTFTSLHTPVASFRTISQFSNVSICYSYTVHCCMRQEGYCAVCVLCVLCVCIRDAPPPSVTVCAVLRLLLTELDRFPRAANVLSAILRHKPVPHGYIRAWVSGAGASGRVAAFSRVSNMLRHPRVSRALSN